MDPSAEASQLADQDRRRAPRPASTTDADRAERQSLRGRFLAELRALGPGLITGAADDDPSGIATYSQAGAAFGYSLLWTAVITLPLMAAVQLMCARIGVVAKAGLASVLRDEYPRPLLWTACGLLVIANTVNIAADLGGMAAGATLLVGGNATWFVPAFTVLILALLILMSYERMSKVFKWLTLALFAYVIAGFLAKPSWGEVGRAIVAPGIARSLAPLMMFVAILGTTISPYLFFWQAAQNAEQDAHLADVTRGRRRRSVGRELRTAARDVNAGMVLSNAIMFFIILTAGATLHKAGHTDIQTAREAAAALRPFAGRGAEVLFALGLVGTGMLGVPVLAGSAAYAVGGAAAWRTGMDERFGEATRFYGVMAVAMLGGMVLDFVHVNPIRLLIWSAVVNGLLAPPLIAIVLVVCNNRRIMGTHRNGTGMNVLGGAALLLMTASAVALVVSWLV